MAEQDQQDQLARTLLIELIAYQFASPVQWIRTQDSILAHQNDERVIEIGPNATLAGMLKRTMKGHRYFSREQARPVPRTVLSSELDTAEIYYATIQPESSRELIEENSAGETTSGAKAQSDIVANNQFPKKHEHPITKRIDVVAREIEDQRVEAKDVVLMILSRGLRRSSHEIDPSVSIKSLAGGRSTLQNEMVGDLQAEFGVVPDRAEDMTLNDLSTTLQDGYEGSLGKLSQSIIGTMHASKMPPAFTVTEARDYMKRQWGLRAGRQDTCLVMAASMQPTVRLTSESDAREFFDKIAQMYALRNGLTLLSPSAANNQSVADPSAVMMDSEAIRTLNKGQTELSEKLLKIYGAQLGIDTEADYSAIQERHQEIEQRLQRQLDVWNAEYGLDFFDGIQPKFDARKIRTYDSAWCWAVQELLKLSHAISTALRQGNIDEIDHNKIEALGRHISDAIEYESLSIVETICKRFADTSMRVPLMNIQTQCLKSLQSGPQLRRPPHLLAPYTSIEADGTVRYAEKPRIKPTRFSHLTLRHSLSRSNSVMQEPPVHLKEHRFGRWEYSEELTTMLENAFNAFEEAGESFHGRTVLITGAGIGSIGASILRLLLAGGAKVLVTSSRTSAEVASQYQGIYMDYGARGSELHVIPFNQSSIQDINSLIDYIYDKKGLGWDLDYLLPFAAFGEKGQDISLVDSRAELAHRAMMINVVRLLGTVKSYKEKNSCFSRPTQVILPLSPNHGTLGGDGLYGESKLALETLLNRSQSEDWAGYLAVCGAVIGWTRGTGLMNTNDVTAEGMERAGLLTFSQDEMAHCLVCLMTTTINSLCQEGPVYADLTGGMARMPDVAQLVKAVRQDIHERSRTQRLIWEEDNSNSRPASQRDKHEMEQRAHVRLDFPSLSTYDKATEGVDPDLRDTVDLDRVVIITGFGELGPHGNARTRWEMEAQGQLSLAGCIEMAWLMGFIRHDSGIRNGKAYSGWVDAKTNEPLTDKDVKVRFEKQILSHSGIRLVEPNLFNGYDPEKKQSLQEVVLQEDLGPIEVMTSLAKEMKLQHGEQVIVAESQTSPDMCRVRLLKGTTILIPRASNFDRAVAGQIPSGWDPKTYGIPEDIATQVDRVTLYTLVAAADALWSSGIVDPYELYSHVHVSEVGNCIGSGIGGFNSLQKMFRSRYQGEPVQSDILQETFINTTSAWVNMLLLGARGPIRTPVGACATSVESLELGFDSIVTGKAKICIVGGCDDFGEELSQEFANMKATASSTDEFSRGRSPGEMSRPTTTTRNGFVESHGSGVQILTTAKIALEMGLPIRGIVAFVGTSSDGVGRSIPAPGMGVLGNAREVKGPASYSLNVADRKRRLQLRLEHIAQSRIAALKRVAIEETSLSSHSAETDTEAFIKARYAQVHAEYDREESDARFTLGQNLWHGDSTVSPLRGALATWGLTIDDLDIASFHGTSTSLNDYNESRVIQEQLRSLGRSSGNPILSVFQKSLTGHPKGAAGAWMLNGALQMLETGFVPGNRNADNVDQKLKQFDLIAYINRGIQTASIKAVSVTSFGFGQKGAQAICIHPKYLFASLSEDAYENYAERARNRWRKADRFFYQAFVSNRIFQAKSTPPYLPEKEMSVLLDPLTRYHSSTNTR